jgi:nuclear polyadenylated RNA-binding protein 3
MTEPPEFHSKIHSPVSPTPLHPPEPSNIPVLQNQIDPIFNMTSTHIDPPAPAVTAPAGSSMDPVASPVVVDSPADSSFSDAYKDEGDGKDKGQNASANQDEVSDDYAMTFDTDGEEHSDSQDLSRENIQQLSDLPDRALTINTFSNGSDAIPAQSHPIPSNMGAAEATATNPSDPTAPQTGTEPTMPSSNTYGEIASGEIDIQQLLDNITANAEKKEPGSAINTPTSANPLNASTPKAGSSLPPHASLPPRPQVPSSNYNDDMSKYHAATTNFPQAQNSYKPGVNVPLVAAGAPGTYSDPRNGLPPPPTASFRQPPPSTGSPISPGAYPQVARLGGPDRTSRSEPSEDMGDPDIRWPLEIQKKFDQFLVEERGYVTDGQWDKFPVGSRLFIGTWSP